MPTAHPHARLFRRQERYTETAPARSRRSNERARITRATASPNAIPGSPSVNPRAASDAARAAFNAGAWAGKRPTSARWAAAIAAASGEPHGPQTIGEIRPVVAGDRIHRVVHGHMDDGHASVFAEQGPDPPSRLRRARSGSIPSPRRRRAPGLTSAAGSRATRPWRRAPGSHRRLCTLLTYEPPWPQPVCRSCMNGSTRGDRTRIETRRRGDPEELVGILWKSDETRRL